MARIELGPRFSRRNGAFCSMQLRTLLVDRDISGGKER